MNNLAATTELRHPAPAQYEDLLLTCSRTLLSGISSSILVLRSSGQIAFANHAAEEMIGGSSADLAGISFSSLFTEDASLGKANDGDAAPRRGKLRIHGDALLPVRVDIKVLQSSNGDLQGSVVTIEDISDMLQMNECVKQLLQCDTLTGLPKEDTLATSLETALLQLNTIGRSFALLELNVDQFRRVKESLGHDAAAGALREIAARLVRSVRNGDVVTRNTTDAFTILLTNCASQQEALQRAEAVLATFKEPFRFGPYCTQITASIGMSFSRPGTVTTNGFFTEAELAVRRCKALGGNRVVCFESNMADWHSHAVQMESQMQSALVNEEFYVVYQPQVCCQTGRLVGVESLLRWQSPTNGTIMPNTFIPAAEESGLIVPLGEWCLRTSCKEMVSLQRTLGYPVRLAVNVSPKQIHSPGFKDFVRQTLQETGLQPDLLELEITEGLLISHEEEALKAITSLQELGISVAMDDFGMGFSNLSYLNRFNINRLKIDRSFISGCPDDHSSRMITTSLVFLAKSLGIEVVAEGVETQAQASLLAELRCDLAQGYLYSRPTTVSEISAMAASISHSHRMEQALQAAAPAVSTNTVPAEALDSLQAVAASTPSAAPVQGTPALQTPAPADLASLGLAAALQTAPAGMQRNPSAEILTSPQVASTPAPLPATPAQVSAPQPVLSASPAPQASVLSFASVQEPFSSVHLAAAAPNALTASAAELASAERSTGRRNDSTFTAHTILVPVAENPAHGPNEAMTSADRARARRNMAASATVPHLEPREPVCRPSKPMRAPGSVRLRWVSMPDAEAV